MLPPAFWHDGLLFPQHVNAETALDENGIRLPDAEAALVKAKVIKRDIAATSIKTEGHLVLSHRIVAEDADLAVVGTAFFQNVIVVGNDRPVSWQRRAP